MAEISTTITAIGPLVTDEAFTKAVPAHIIHASPGEHGEKQTKPVGVVPPPLLNPIQPPLRARALLDYYDSSSAGSGENRILCIIISISLGSGQPNYTEIKKYTGPLMGRRGLGLASPSAEYFARCPLDRRRRWWNSGLRFRVLG